MTFVSDTRTADAQVGIGYKLPNGTIITAVIIHLVKVNSGTDTPWEVVGMMTGSDCRRPHQYLRSARATVDTRKLMIGNATDWVLDRRNDHFE